MGRQTGYAGRNGTGEKMKSPRKAEGLETTVTFLEMKRPPAKYPPMPLGKHLALLRTRQIPLHFYRYLMDRVGRKWHWVNILRMDDDQLASSIHTTDRDIRVLYLEGSPAGFFDITPSLPISCELTFFGLMDHAAGMGLGRWFLGAAIEAAWSHGPEKIKVQTCTLDHPAALPLYQKLGFEPVGQSKEIIKPLTATERKAAIFR
jgi:GNAT superfamily N-acetyltransferase